MKYTNYPSSTRPTAMGFNGMAASAHPYASMAGINILKKVVMHLMQSLQ